MSRYLRNLFIVLAILAGGSLALWGMCAKKSPRLRTAYSQVLTEITWVRIDYDVVRIDPAGRKILMTHQLFDTRSPPMNTTFETVDLSEDAERYHIISRRDITKGISVNNVFHDLDHHTQQLHIDFGKGVSIASGDIPLPPRAPATLADQLRKAHTRMQ